MADPKPNASHDESHTAAPQDPAAQSQVRIDEAAMVTHYSATARLHATAEEIIVDFSQGIRPTNQTNVAVMKIDSRIIMSPWAAKRLALSLGQTIQRYEQTYGPIEIDPRKRQVGG